MVINKLHNSIKSIDSYADDWQRNAEIDPFWVILADPKCYGGKWDVAEFFATGEEEIDRVFKFMERKSITLPTGPFLDFGCGIGRVSKALVKNFGNGFGIDVAPKMVELARKYVNGVDFIVNQTDSLNQFSDNSIGFIYSHMVLQHIPNQYQKRYIEEFLRILKPGGLAVFQIPIEMVNFIEAKPKASYRLRKILKHWFPFLVTLKRWLCDNVEPQLEFKIEMHVLPQDIIEQVCRNRGCFIEVSVATNSCDVDHDGKVEFLDLDEYRDEMINSKEFNLYLSCMYFVRKPHEH
jgi:ubiquinone/menaquinone biosynthesis C-methylase UbiE